MSSTAVDNFLSKLPFNVTPELMNSSRIQSMLSDHFSQESNELMNQFFEVTFITLYASFSVIAITVNILIASIIIRKRSLQNRTNLLIVNLMIADLLLAIICMPLTLLTFIRKSWPLGSLLCKVIPVAQGLTVFAASLTIAVIAIDRLLRVTSNKPQRAISRNQTLTFEVLFIWITSLVLSLPQAFYQEQVQIGIPGLYEYTKCVESSKSPLMNLYSVLISIIQLFVPSISLFLSYFKIKYHLRNNMCNIKPKRGSEPPTVTTTSSKNCVNSDSIIDSSEIDQQKYIDDGPNALNESNQSALQRKFKTEMSRNKTVTNMLLLITAAFVGAWTPWNIISIVLDFAPEAIGSVDNFLEILAAAHLLAMTSATLNPLLYGYWNPSIKKEIIKSRQRSTSV